MRFGLMRPKEPRLADQLAPSERRAARFLTLLTAFMGSALVLLGGFNFLMDPYGSYGSPLRLDRPRPVRILKLELLRDASPPPQALILGSSRVRTIAPEEVSRLFDLTAFHAGGLKSSPQNWLSITRYAVDGLGHPIRLVILGVDPSSFADHTNYLQHPAGIPALRGLLRHPRLSQFRSWVHLWSPAQTKASLGLLAYAARSTGPVDPNPFRIDESGFARRVHALDPADITETAIDLHRTRGIVEREHVDDFEAFLDFAAERNIRILAYVTPEAPALAATLSTTHYPETLVETRSILREASRRSLILCEVDSLGLRRSDFVDPHHPSQRAGDRILGALRRCASERGVD